MDVTPDQNSQRMNVSIGFILGFGALIVILSIGVYVLVTSGALPILPEQASLQAQNTDQLFYIFLGIGAFVFFLVQGLLLYSVIRFRANPTDTTDGPAVHGNTTLEIVWTIIPSVVVVILSVLAFVVWSTNNEPQENENFVNGESIPVSALGQRYAWSFTWDTGQQDVDGNDIFLTSSELHTYVGQNMSLDMTTQDVIHSFWVPVMRVKQDLLPGRTTTIRFTPIETDAGFEYTQLNGPVSLLTATENGEVVLEVPDGENLEVKLLEQTELGDFHYVRTNDNVEGWVSVNEIDHLYNRYRLICTELCGGGHGEMFSWLVVHQDESAFLANYYEPEVAKLVVPPEDPVLFGEQVLSGAVYPCASCHVLDSLGWAGVTGPSLNGIADRAGDRVSTLDGAEYLIESLHLPNEYIVPGYNAGQMPHFGLSEEAPEGQAPYTFMPNDDLIGIVAYLCTQTASGDVADSTCGVDLTDIDATNARLQEISETYYGLYGIE